jgi:tetratricopeptide (TPR) repeat protein/transcriptional regulator with XRE-family HTH domain
LPEPSSESFAALLRHLRAEANLTQEELADKAGISSRSVSDLERGINQTARRDTARMLADAFELSGQARMKFEAVARGRASDSWSERDFASDADATDGVDGADREATGLAAATRTLPRDIASFTGRESELSLLDEAVSDGAASGTTTVDGSGAGGVVDVCAIGGMAGIGKTTFAIHVAHQLADRYPDGQIFLSLHGHTPGQQPVSATDALASLLQTTGVAAQQIPSGLQERIRLWRDRLAGRRFLVVLDDALGHDQVRPLLPGTAGSLVLITSRRHLTALEDVKVISLDTPPATEAAQMLARLAGRPALDLDDPAVAEIITMCGCLPLAIGMAASQLRHHPVWTVADLAADLALSRDRLELLSAENLSVAAAFDLSYRDLDPQEQRLLRCVGLYPGDEIDPYAAAALLDVDYGTVRRLLESLYDHYLLAEPTHGRYRPHDLIREHARALADTEPAADRDAAIARLLDYYLHSARTAGRHLARRIPAGIPDIEVAIPRSAPDLSRLRDAVSWMATERSNLHVAVSYAARHGLVAHAAAIPAAMHGFLRGQGYWDQALILYEGALDAARAVHDQLAEASARTDLGDIQSMSGDHDTATASLRQALEKYRAADDRLGEANALHNLGSVQQRTGDFPAARKTLNAALTLQRAVGNQLGEASVLNSLGSVQYRSGDYQAAIVSLTKALDLQRELGNRLGEANAFNELGIARSLTGAHDEAIAELAKALELHRELDHRLGVANATRDLGRAQLAAGDHQAAVSSLTAAVTMQHELGNKFGEANAAADLDRAVLARSHRASPPLAG